MNYSNLLISFFTLVLFNTNPVLSVQSDNDIQCPTTKRDEDPSRHIVESLSKKVESLQSDVLDQREIINMQTVAINALEDTARNYETLMSEMSQQLKVITEDSYQQLSDLQYQHTTFGCLSDVLTLSCPDNRTINVTRAYYGMYFFACDFGCCAPHPTEDCSELVEVNRPAVWLAILASCNGQENCTYENRGSPIDECQEGYMADWLQIYYQCTSVPLDDPVGFTAYAPSESMFYGEGQLVNYPIVVSNLGGYYNKATYVFICPVDGVYVFTVHAHNINQDFFYSDIMLGNSLKLAANAYIHTDRGHAGATLVTKCNAGVPVWIMGHGTMLGYRVSHFTGYLLYRY